MIPYRQITNINIGPITIKLWGLLVALGIAIALVLALRRAKKVGIRQAWVYDLTFYSIVAGFIGARAGHVLFSWPEGLPLTLLGAIDLTKGGLSFTFGLAAALTASFIYMKYKKIDALRFADFIAPYIVIAHIISRVGCFLTGMHIGKQTSFFLGVMVDGAVRHNVALYEIIILLAMLAALAYLRRFALPEGSIFATYLLLYAVLRFPLDFLRTDPTYYGLTAAQYVLMGIFALSLGFFCCRKRMRKQG